MKIKNIYSPNFNIKERASNSIKFIVLHYTGMQSERVSIKRLTSKSSKVSSHYLINRKGKIIKMVDEKNIAWHAGKSKWKNIKNLNNYSIGIELVNKGHKFGYQSFTSAQISQLISLCRVLIKKYKINKKNILGHSDIAPLRKTDPGEKFPWFYLSNKGVGSYYKNIKNNKIKKVNRTIIRKYFFNNLYKIGYRYFFKNKNINSDSKIIKAFQRRYRQNKVDGLIDSECLKISTFLLKNFKN